MDSKIRKIIAWCILSAVFVSAYSVLFFYAHSYVDRRIYKIATGAGANDLHLELQKAIQVLADLNNSHRLCAPGMLSGLQAFVDHSSLFYSSAISAKGYSTCSVSSSVVRDTTGPVLSWGIYSIGINRTQLEKNLDLPFWLSLTVQDSVEHVVERFGSSEKKAMVAAVGSSQVYVSFDSDQMWLWQAVLCMCLLLCWIMISAHNPNSERYRKSDARLIKALLKNQHVNLYYRPIVDLESGNWIGAEALLRCVDVTTDSYYPAPYIFEIAEHHDHAYQLFREVCYQVACDFNTHFRAFDSFCLTINVTNKNLSYPSCALHIQEVYKEFDVSPSSIIFQVTETVLITDQAVICNVLKLKNMGFRFALVTACPGSLQYLEKFPVDFMKLDISFFQLGHDRVLAYGAYLAKLKKVKVIVAGIDTMEQNHELIEEGVCMGQGSYFASAMPAATLVRKYFIDNQREEVFATI